MSEYCGMRGKSMMRLAVLAIVVLTGCRSATVAPDDAGARLDRFFTTLHAHGLFDGAVVVGERDRIVWEKGFGIANAASGTPFTPDTPTDSGSLAKTFTAALAIALQREGRLSLDAPARELLPELPYAEITLRHLLSHSSGLPWDYAWFDPFLPAGEVRTTERLLEAIAAQKPPLAFAAGTAFEYNSVGYDLASLAIARAAGKPYGELLAERWFRPLGMTSAFLRPGRLDAFPAPRTLAYRRVDGKLELHDVFDFEAFHGGSNIYLSARDLHRWNASFFSDLHRDPELLEPARIDGRPSGLTLGSWYRSPDGGFWYSGHLQGFHNEVFRNVRSGVSVVYVSNNTIEPWVQKAIVRGVTRILAGQSVEVPPGPMTEEVAPDARASLSGTWMLARNGPLVIESSGRGVRVARHGMSYAAVPVDTRSFYVPGLDLMLGLTKDRQLCVSTNVDEECARREEDR